jgi:F0F1-type ATP synthase membrane subunit b/b'
MNLLHWKNNNCILDNILQGGSALIKESLIFLGMAWKLVFKPILNRLRQRKRILEKKLKEP